jgi:hypothetical protein
LVFGDIAETEDEAVARGASGVTGRERPEPEFVLGGTGGEGYITQTAAGAIRDTVAFAVAHTASGTIAAFEASGEGDREMHARF